MSSRFLKKPLWPLSISSYAFLFIGLSFLSYTLLGWLAFDQMSQLQDETTHANRHAAEQELSISISHVVDHVRDIGNELATQNEIHGRSAVFELQSRWKNRPSSESKLASTHIRSIEIYGSDGKRSGLEQTDDMPAQIDTANLTPYLIPNGAHPDLLYFMPVEEGEGSVAGYIGLRADFMKALLQLNQFRYLDHSSLSILFETEAPIPLEKAGEFIRFDLLRNPETTVVQEIMESSLFRLAVVVILLSAVFYLLGTLIFDIPLRQLSEHIDKLKQSPAGLLLEKPRHSLPVRELEKVRSSLNEYQGQLEDIHQSLDRKNEELWKSVYHDPLTGTRNRKAFDDDWNKIQAVAAGKRLNICLIIFDCNHFKAINDSYGHSVGDEVIKAIAACLNNALRRGDKLYRLGGDEFASIMFNCPPKSAGAIGERCVDQVNNFDFTQLGIKEPVRLSVGISFAEASSSIDFNALKWQADMAMYNAKRPGNGCIAYYSEETTESAKPVFSSWTTNAVYEAVTKGTGLEIHYQPIVCLATGAIQYYEALLRIRNNGTLILPSNIFPIIEARRLEVELDYAVFERVLIDLRSGKLPQLTGLSLNISGPSIIRSDIIEKLKPFTPFMKNLKFVLEITETALITHLHKATKNLTQLQQMGFIVALDDFGSGYSSLRYLANMPVDVVKFDISMVHCLEHDHQHRVIIESLATMISEAGYQMVAEGIETDSLRERVSQMGFHFGQGFLFGRPVSNIARAKSRNQAAG